jgi:RND family efflux transporter MFP subunit
VSDASVQSERRYSVTAPQDGYLERILIKPGALVKKGDALAQLKEDELRLEYNKYLSQKQQAQQEYDNALASANRSQAAIAAEKINQANAQLALSEQKWVHSRLVAPEDGIITSDDISHTQGAPVKQGQLLFEVSANQHYTLHLWVNEQDITRIIPEQTGILKLSSLPNQSFSFRVARITPLSEIKDARNCFRVEATLQEQSPLLRPGMTGAGKVAVGREFLVWILFHDVIDWLRMQLWL